MGFEFHGTYRISDKSDIEYVTYARNDFSQLKEIPARIAVLAQAMNLGRRDKSSAQAGDNEGLKYLIHKQHEYDDFIQKALTQMKSFSLVTPDVRLVDLPQFSFFLQFEFTLAKPSISRDDESFYIIDNPLKKDKVFKVPFIASSSWKGNLREALRLAKDWDDKQEEMIRLFGNPKEEEEHNLKQGRLRFYPTYFDKIDLEIINPHDRKTKAGRNPIYFEVAPIGAKGDFNIMYIPFDLIGKPESEVKDEALADLRIVVEGVRAMMFDYGFSAKKSSGYGIIDDESVSGALDVVGIELFDSNGKKDNTYRCFGSIENDKSVPSLCGLVKRLTEKGKEQ